MRISEKSTNDYPLIARIIFWAQKKKYGEILLPSKLWGRSPKVLYGLQALYRAIDRKGSPLEPTLRSLIGVQISRINHCAFCVDIGTSLLKKRDVSPEKIGQLLAFETSPLFNDRERAALAFSECVTKSDRRVSDEVFQRLKRHFSDDEIIELTALIAYQNMTSRFNKALDVPTQDFCARIP
jgi:uncharacterized peroxidase-related enzyme